MAGSTHPRTSDELLGLLVCPDCRGELELQERGGERSGEQIQQLLCKSCARSIPLHQGIPLFTQAPEDLVPSPRIERGPGIGTPWRQANWRFLESELDRLPQGAHVLDVGAGRGDFAAAFEKRSHRLTWTALEVYPYPEVDIVCDLTQHNPFRQASFDAVLLLNVLEHVYDTHALLETISDILKPGGVLIVAIPFMVKVHQAPVDFVRYTHFALARLAEQHGFQVERLEGYYDPLFFLGEGIGNLKNAVLPEMKGPGRRLAVVFVRGISLLAGMLGSVLGPGKTLQIYPAARMYPSAPTEQTKSMTPTGYHILYRKKSDVRG